MTDLGKQLLIHRFEQSKKRAESLGLASSSWSTIGSFGDTGLEAASMDAAMSLDALQYPPAETAAVREFSRIVRPGGRLAFFTFELDAEKVLGLE
jgi:ubiquinone/menaquinone biosynthesis C-methylase UbiE